MRIRLYLKPRDEGLTCIPVNYQYPLSAAIYAILRKAEPSYASFLHERGYTAFSGRSMKLFTFSKLWIPDVRIQGNRLAGSGQLWKLQISSPFQEEFVRGVVNGLFLHRTLEIAGSGCRARFEIQQVEMIPTPEFGEKTFFRCLSPVVVSTMHLHRGRLHAKYLRPDDSRYSELIRKNLLQKYEIIHRKLPTDQRLRLTLSKGSKPRSRLITIKEGTPDATHIRAFEYHFALEGNPELMKIAWECGLGEHNAQGFGMIETLPQGPDATGASKRQA